MEEEVEILQSIFLEDIILVDLKCARPYFEIAIYPAIENEDSLKSICLNLGIYFPQNYPNEIPEFVLKNIRGVLEDDVSKIKNEVHEIAKRNLGSPMMFEIFQYIKDVLTEHGNVPKSCACAICLYNFDIMQKFTRLHCFHYFHIKCLLKHVNYMDEEIRNERNEALRNKIKWIPRHVSCPVCREPLNDDELECINRDIYSNDEVFSSDSNDEIISISNKTRELQKKMQIIYERQKLCGGIIDKSSETIEVIVLTRPNQPVSNEVDHQLDQITHNI